MTEEQINKATILVALLHNCQSLLDDLPVKAEFKQKLKFTAKNFSSELDLFIQKFYHNMNEESNIEYNKVLSMYELYIQEIINGNVRFEENVDN